MASSGVIGIKLKIDGAGAAKNDLDKVSRSIRSLGDDKLFNGIAKGVAGIGAAVGAAALGASVAVGAFVKTSLDSLARIERINAQTDSVIKSTNGAAKVTAQHVEDMTGALENQTGTEAESIQQGANMLLTFTNIKNAAGDNNDIFDQATKTITDMSRAFDTTGGAVIDTTTQAIQLGKALNDPIKGVTALRKVGVSFTEDQQKQIKAMVGANDTLGAQKVILAELQKEFGGAGEAFAKTSKGQIELAGHAWGTFGEALSSALLPAIGTVAGGLAELFNYAATEVPNLQGTFSGLADKMVGATHRIVGGVKSVIDNLDDMKISIAYAFDAEKEVSQNGTTALANSLQKAFGLSDGTTANLQNFMDTFVAGAQGVLTALTPVWQGIQNAPVSGLSVLQASLQWMADHQEAVRAMATAITTVAFAVTAANLATKLYSGALLIVGPVIRVWTAATAAQAAGQSVLNAVMEANPIGIIIVALTALVAGVVWAYRNVGWFKTGVDALWAGLKTAGSWIKDTLAPILQTVLVAGIDVAKARFDSIRDAVGGFVDKIKDAWDWIKKLADRITGSGVAKFLSSGVSGVADLLGGGGSRPPAANGGPAQAGTVGLVGEQGPELFVAPANGQILSNKDSMAAISGSLAHLVPTEGSQAPIQLDVYLDGEPLFANWQRRASKKMARA